MMATTRRDLVGLTAAMLTAGLAPGARAAAPGSASTAYGAAAPVSEAEAHAIGVQAYLYLYSLLTMDITRQQLTNVARDEGLAAPMNVFANVPAYPTAAMKIVVRPNFDTLYSSVWLDLTQEPMVVSAPDTDGRYYMLPMLDMWTDVFASPGARTTGTGAGSWAVVPPGWRGTVPDGVRRIDAPTPYVWVIGRTQTNGPADYDAVHKIQAGYRITPLSRWGKPPGPIIGKVDPTIDMKTSPKIQVDTMPAGAFFARAAEVLKLQPPHLTDQPIVALMRRIGLEPGKSFDLDAAAPAVKRVLLARAGRCPETHGVEGQDTRPGREWLVDEHRYDGSLRHLLSQARDRHPVRPRREPAGGRDLSAQPCR